MVTVPVFRGNNVERAARPVGAVQPVRNPIGEAIGDGVRDLGGQAVGYARQQDALNEEFDKTQARQLLLDYQSQANPLVTSYLSSEGIDALNGSSGTREQLTKLRQDFSGKATNDRMRRFFDQAAVGIETGFADKIGTHSIGALKTQQVTVAKGEQAQFMDTAVMNWSDDKAFRANLDAGLTAVEAEAKVHGITGVGLTVAKRNYTSATRLAVLNQLLADNRQDDAIGYAAVHRGDFNADHTLSVTRILKEPMELRFATAAADKFFGGQSAPNVPAGDGVAYSSNSLFQNGIIPIEGGTGKGGQFLTSPKGAIGPAQVMPGTAPEAAKLAGLRWDENKYKTDHAYNVALGEAYFKKQLSDFGDPLKAAAAYNAGPGSATRGTGVRGAIAKAAKSGKDWRDHLPAETKKYVTDFAARMGVAGASTDIDPAAEIQRFETFAAQEGFTPEQKKIAQAEVDRRIARAKTIQSGREEQAYDAGVSRAVQLGDAFTDVSQLGTSFASMSPQQQMTMKNMAESNLRSRIAAERPREGGSKAIELGVLSTIDPDAFTRTDLRPFQNQMTPGEYKTLIGRQAKYASREEVSIRSKISSTIAFWSKTDKLSLDPKDDPEKFVKVYDDMEGYLTSQTGGKRQPTDDELRIAYQRATLSVSVPGKLWGTNEKRRFEVEPGEAYSVPSIPANVRSRIVSAWARNHNGREPNDTQVTQTYVTNLGRPGFW
ncbi:transglycosylase SLT domain-containing protein [Sphingobium sp. Z007]|uniref:transglycosylase SLT domain-containing protein n=1 Tax=Sphingobium sp. Z007 TaxID=627495 RepID=UPI001C3D5588|nr:transglycosylase SLT domain-containing protein [Sphingobium sp. Z007]